MRSTPAPCAGPVETATPLAELTGLEILTRDLLAEFDSDANFYIPLEELQADRDARFAKLIEDWTGPARAGDRAEFRAGV